MAVPHVVLQHPAVMALYALFVLSHNPLPIKFPILNAQLLNPPPIKAYPLINNIP